MTEKKNVATFILSVFNKNTFQRMRCKFRNWHSMLCLVEKNNNVYMQTSKRLYLDGWCTSMEMCSYSSPLSLTERANPRENRRASNQTEPLFERNSYGGIAELSFAQYFPSWNTRRLKCRAASAYAAYGKRPVVLHSKYSLRLYEQNQCSRWNDIILCEWNFGQWLEPRNFDADLHMKHNEN